MRNDLKYFGSIQAGIVCCPKACGL